MEYQLFQNHQFCLEGYSNNQGNKKSTEGSQFYISIYCSIVSGRKCKFKYGEGDCNSIKILNSPKVLHSKSWHVILTENKYRMSCPLDLQKMQKGHLKILVLPCVCWKEYNMLESMLLLHLSCNPYVNRNSCSDINLQKYKNKLQWVI
jgi:hypothetical protein